MHSHTEQWSKILAEVDVGDKAKSIGCVIPVVLLVGFFVWMHYRKAENREAKERERTTETESREAEERRREAEETRRKERVDQTLKDLAERHNAELEWSGRVFYTLELQDALRKHGDRAIFVCRIEDVFKMGDGFRIVSRYVDVYADSRVPANQIIGLQPGDVFVHRNVANVVVHSDINCLSVIEYAVAILKVKHIIVCGHYGCGGVNAALENHELGLIDNWLRHLRDVRQKHEQTLSRIRDDKQRLDLLCELNVVEQVQHVCSTTIVQQAWRDGRELAVHAAGGEFFSDLVALGQGLAEPVVGSHRRQVESPCGQKVFTSVRDAICECYPPTSVSCSDLAVYSGCRRRRSSLPNP